ncbi:hypothetical protein MTO96_013134 [Rhipicephalus appendiculatus]
MLQTVSPPVPNLWASVVPSSPANCARSRDCFSRPPPQRAGRSKRAAAPTPASKSAGRVQSKFASSHRGRRPAEEADRSRPKVEAA